MSYFAENQKMEEANSGDFTFVLEGTTSYSKEYGVSQLAMSELLIQVSSLASDINGGTLAFTLQVYCSGTATWYDHAAAFSGYSDGNGTTSASLDIATAFGTRIRMRVISGGTFDTGNNEQYIITMGMIGKSG